MFVFVCVAFPSRAFAGEISGYVAAEGRYFFNGPLFSGQKRHDASLALQPEYYHQWGSGSSFTFEPFARVDSADPERTHFDIRELNVLWLGDPWELRIGIGKVFWGVTEFVHLVDIINQTDLVENINGEDKLGQPMINLTVPADWGVIDLFVLPYFRERTFPGHKGRLRSGPEIDADRTLYESPAKEHHIDLAIRYSHTIGDWDFGIYNFNGTGREPTLLLRIGPGGNPFLVPYYEQINQTGLDVQAVKGNWLYKLEAIYRTGQGEGFFADAGGFEYTMTNILSSGMDLGLIGEWAYDERGDKATTAFQNDLMLGLRWALNDAASSNLLVGFIQDLDRHSRALKVKGSRRFGDNWLLSLDAWAFLNVSREDIIYSLRDDDYLQLQVAYYF
ncbi:MAG TPA: hypothetical protein ENG86_10245 [Nitrospirae bacterium]|nr:hypothetical protein [Nitrospirota bacterium]HDO23207.1 hypothetical protein [Nitrospirota bacterium]